MEDQQPRPRARRKQLSSAERRLIVDWLLAQSNKGALENGDIKACAERFGTNRKSVAQIWKRYKDEGSTERRRTNSGRRLSLDVPSLRAAVKELRLTQRTTWRRLALALGVPKSTLFMHRKELGLVSHSRGRVARAGTPIPAELPVSDRHVSNSVAVVEGGLHSSVFTEPESDHEDCDDGGDEGGGEGV